MRSYTVNSESQRAELVGPQPPCRYRGLIEGINYISGTVGLQRKVQNLLFVFLIVASVSFSCLCSAVTEDIMETVIALQCKP